ncbi:hypothetical protein DPMN_079181 [Dreissena polymorpha]|uniref:Uncharacterized protein n=1 Tax=Dreissena polymorpha TaxID=45954 RepID=A0A9D3YTB4_DREPO|nr:hypothetical protein DPMN_079181 [Dreissena polymorpha]
MDFRSEQEKLAHQLARANSPTQDVPDDFHEQAAQFSETDDDDEEPKLPVFQAHVQVSCVGHLVGKGLEKRLY